VFEKGFTCVEYGSAERELLHRFKYRDQAYLGRKMAGLMYDRIRLEELKPDLILPVPMFRKKQNKRGYNQAAILAFGLAGRMDVPYSEKYLVRKVETKAMSSLGLSDRKRNLREVFTVPHDKIEGVRSKTVLLVDDIYTTGSTADACASVLLAAGASSVYVITFASGANLRACPENIE
jgi:ComF family protein